MVSLLERWRSLSARGRILLAVVVAAVVLAAACAGALRRDARVAMFAAPLRAEQLNEVVERLAAWNVTFVASSDNVRVDARRRNELLLRLSLAGVPHPHRPDSAEALAKANPLLPQSLLDAAQREGLAGDLSAGLRGIDGVEDAQVVVAPGRSGAFADEASSPPTASVRIALKPGARLSAQAVDGIRRFVAGGVSGLDPKRVAIVDDRGTALGDERKAGDEASALQSSLQSVLDEAFGAGATIVRVRVETDARTRRLYDVRRAPLAGAPLARTSLDERYAGDKKKYSKTRADEDRGSDVREERTEVPAGRVQRLSVAVAVDAARGLDKRAIVSLATAALGIVPSRDTLRVEEVAFARKAAALPSPLWSLFGLAARLVPLGFLALIALAAIRHGALPLARALEAFADRTTALQTARAIAAYAPAQVRGVLRDEPPHTAAAIISALPAATAAAVLDMYSLEERAAIVRRMQRAVAPVAPDFETLVQRA